MLPQSIRTLYSLNSLGVDAYVATREKVQSYLQDGGVKFRSKMSEFLQEDSRNMIFTEDLKNMVHIVEKNQADVDLTIKMLKKYVHSIRLTSYLQPFHFRFNTQNKEVRFGNFIFGPVVMRMFHYLKEEELALQVTQILLQHCK